jgi:hypothetical protein
MSRGARTRPSTLVGAWVGNGLVTNLGDYESIATVTVGSGGQATITFSSIPSTYKHLQLRYTARTDRAATQDFLLTRFNSDTGSNYSYHQLYGDGSAAGSSAGTTQTSMQSGVTAGATATASIFGAGFIDILDYADTNKYKTLRTLDGLDRNGAGQVEVYSGNWRSTSAVSTITITSFGSANFVQYSQFALYGIKG